MLLQVLESHEIKGCVECNVDSRSINNRQEQINKMNTRSRFITLFIFSLVITTLTVEYCHTEYKIIWQNQYIEMEGHECHIVDEKWCSEICKPHESKYCEPHKEELCSWEKKTECKEIHKKIHVPFTETECKKNEKKVCEYEWQGTRLVNLLDFERVAVAKFIGATAVRVPVVFNPGRRSKKDKSEGK